MADEITRTRHIGQIQPLSRTGENPPRQPPRQPERKKPRRGGDGKSSDSDGSTPRVDEYA